MTRSRKPEKPTKAGAADVGRRSFFLKMGAGVSTALASTAGIAASGGGEDAPLRAARLEEEKALRKLHQAFEQAIDQGRYDEVVEMFADDARVIFNGGVFEHRGRGVDRLYRDRFASVKAGKRMEPAPGFEVEADRLEERVEVSADLLSAKAVFPYSIQVGEPIETESSLAGMARLHGGGVRTWWEGGVYDVRYRRDALDGRWRIGRIEYRTLSRADYRPGRTYALPISVSPISARYPEDPHGPDALIHA